MRASERPVPPASAWSPERPARPPGDGEVQVWLASLDAPPLALDQLGLSLSDDERSRAERFRFEIHRRRFTAGRGLVRELLGRLTGVAPERLVFGYGEKGKPFLTLPGCDLTFNLSHSEDLALLAVARGRELGVDIEALRPLEDAEAIVERFFAPGERRTFAGLSAAERPAGFFSAWTRKEAYVKARGDGLSLPTTAFEVTLPPAEPPRLVAFPAEPGELARWSFSAFEPAEGFLGALAVEGTAAAVATRLWTE